MTGGLCIVSLLALFGGLAVVLMTPVLACLWHEDGCIDRRRRR